MSKGLHTGRLRRSAPSAILVLRAETPQVRELFELFQRLSPDQRQAVLAQLRELVARAARAGN